MSNGLHLHDQRMDRKPGQEIYLRINQDRSLYFQDLHLKRLLNLNDQSASFTSVLRGDVYLNSKINRYSVSTAHTFRQDSPLTNIK